MEISITGLTESYDVTRDIPATIWCGKWSGSLPSQRTVASIGSSLPTWATRSPISTGGPSIHSSILTNHRDFMFKQSKDYDFELNMNITRDILIFSGIILTQTCLCLTKTSTFSSCYQKVLFKNIFLIKFYTGLQLVIIATGVSSCGCLSLKSEQYNFTISVVRR